MSRPPMSMEAMLDEERREVLALLEGPAKPRAPSSLGARSPSPFTPRSPVRSMLDIGDNPTAASITSNPSSAIAKTDSPRIAPVRSMLDVDSPPPPVVRSMLDVDDPPASPPLSGNQVVFSNPSSPTETSFRTHAASNTTHPRSLSDVGGRPEFGPRASARMDPTADYQFSGIITNNAGQALPKRVTQGGKQSARSSMAEVMRGNDVSGLVLPGDRGRHYSVAGPSLRLGNKSKSPHNRLGLRSNSPHNSLFGRALSPAGRAILEESQGMEFSNAYKRLSDANLARSDGSLRELTRRKQSDELSNTGRLAKVYMSPDGELLPEDSSEDNEGSSSDEEGERGRKAARSFDRAGDKTNVAESPETKRKALSLLAAAEEERIEVASKQPPHKYRSLLDEPEITVTNPSGEKVKNKPGSIHPASSFDLPPPRSGTQTPMDSDEEADLTDIKRAQKLSFSVTQVISSADSPRTVQIITRGEYIKIVQEANGEHGTEARKYLVATDLSDESTHALEWAIGTVLRDGDTLLAIYCMDEETSILGTDGQLIPDDPKVMREQAAAIQNIASGKIPTPMPGLNRASPLGHAASTSSISPSPAPSSRERSKAEEERYRAAQDITDRVTKLLRKTRLQVRVIVEVLHCKNPKHLITEVIDYVDPTLVILGSRGRSALKGVILGSFSNYLVTKSSVPVMVARKRLRKQSKYKKLPATHQVNNLSSPAARSLANAKID
ncbi:hypothetical protein GQ53DRAFT_846060 [Thozetella sp. PMI_491]|nr:hypothetical protein GQ53DRAFT_846060 [Thozetella sp. PMI_491]